MRNVPADVKECDEVWPFAYAKARNLPTAINAPKDAGDLWTWIVLDPASKLMISWHVGGGAGSQVPRTALPRHLQRVGGSTGTPPVGALKQRARP